jgi:transcriptional regulator with XRE-family HTH domain
MSDKERANDQQTPWEQGDSDAEGFGNWLRQQREVREISLREIAEATKISLRYLEAMEEDRFDLLPAAVFAKGFLRQYARYVGLDSDEVVNRYLSARQMEPEGSSSDNMADYDLSETYSSRSARSSRGGSATRAVNWTVVLIALVVLALLAAAVFWLPDFLGGGEESPDELPTGVAASAPGSDDGDLASGQNEDDEPAAPIAPLVVEVQYEDDCWVRAMVDGKIVEDVTKVQGEALQLTADESVELRLGAPSAVSLIEVNGESYDFDRESEAAIDLSFTAPERDLDDEAAAAPR